MKLKLADAVKLQEGIHKLQGFKFTAAATRKIATNLYALNKAFPDADKKRAEILIAHGNPPETDPRFRAVYDDLIKWQKETVIEVPLSMVKFEELNIGNGDKHNHISPPHLEMLFPILDGADQN